MIMVKINGILVNEDAITSIVIDEEGGTAFVSLNEIDEEGQSVCLHVHGKEAVSYLDAYFSMRVTAYFENDVEPRARLAD